MSIHKGYKFGELGGMPLNQDLLARLQSAYSDVSGVLAGVIGDNAIVSGCVVQGVNVSAGWMVINGELLPFAGGLKGDTIVAGEMLEPLVFANGESKEVVFSRVALFGNGEGEVSFDSLKRVYSLGEIKEVIDRATDDPTVSDPNILASSVAVNALWQKMQKNAIQFAHVAKLDMSVGSLTLDVFHEDWSNLQDYMLDVRIYAIEELIEGGTGELTTYTRAFYRYDSEPLLWSAIDHWADNDAISIFVAYDRGKMLSTGEYYAAITVTKIG